MSHNLEISKQADNLKYRNRKIKSYVSRGRISKSQKRALIKLAPQFAIVPNQSKGLLVYPQSWFKDANLQVALEIGFGMGENLINNAQNLKKFNWIGVETYDAGVGRVFNKAFQSELENLKIYHGDVLDLLEKLNEQSISLVQIFFPDPWQKKKHHKRRLIQSSFIQKLAEKMAINSRLELATDWQNYAAHIEEIFNQDAVKSLFKSESKNFYSKRSELRVLTNFEKKAQKAKRAVYDFCFLRTDKLGHKNAKSEKNE